MIITQFGICYYNYSVPPTHRLESIKHAYIRLRNLCPFLTPLNDPLTIHLYLQTLRTMRFCTIFAAVAAIATTGAAAVSADALLAELTKLNLTSLVGAATTIANTTAGKSLLTTLTSGETLTILAPNNAVRVSSPFTCHPTSSTSRLLFFPCLAGIFRYQPFLC